MKLLAISNIHDSSLICNFCHIFHSCVPKTIKDSVIVWKNSVKVLKLFCYDVCKYFLTWCTSLIFTLSIKSTFNYPKYLLRSDQLRLDKVRLVLSSSVRIVGQDIMTLLFGSVFVTYCFSWSNSSRISLDVFETISLFFHNAKLCVLVTF